MVKHPDVELLLTQALRPAFDGVSVGVDQQDSPSITVTRRGGRTKRPIEQVQVGINIYEKDDVRANDLAASVTSFLNDLRTDKLMLVKCNGWGRISNDNDSIKQRYFVATVQVRTI